MTVATPSRPVDFRAPWERGGGRAGLRLKRSLDVAVSGLGLVALAPALALIAWSIRADSPGPVFYSQRRCGEGRRPFRIYKFRTMVIDAEERLPEVLHLNVHARDLGDGRLYKIADDPRVTPNGAFLRRYSLDELPQLLNVLRGEMSLVGPRPLTPDEDRHVTEEANLRGTVRPGMTGPWQVQGRNEIPFDEMMRLDCAYVTEWSFARDLRLLALTIPAVFRAQRAG